MRPIDKFEFKPFFCDCGEELVAISYIPAELDWDPPEDRFIYLSWWSHEGHLWTWGLRERLRLCWWILFKKQGWMDEIVLTAEKAKKLSDTLLEAVGVVWPEGVNETRISNKDSENAADFSK